MSSRSVEDQTRQLDLKFRELKCNAQPETNSQPWSERVAGALNDDQVCAAGLKVGVEIRKADRLEVAGE